MAGRLITARYAGRCAANCGTRIQEGDAIFYDGRARHEQCPTAQREYAPGRSPIKTQEERIVAEIAKIDTAAAQGRTLAYIEDGIREDEVLNGDQVEALCAYAKWAVAQAIVSRDFDARVADGECPGNLAEEQNALGEFAWSERRRALAC